jgi:hypothetical protein
MRTQRLWLIGFVVLLTAQAQAASVGVFCWQLPPFADVVCFDMDDGPQRAQTFALFGTISVKGKYRYPIMGSLALDEFAQLYHMSWVTHVSASQVRFGADLDPKTFQGPFFTNVGTGTMVFLGVGASVVASAQSADENQEDQETLLDQTQ